MICSLLSQVYVCLTIRALYYQDITLISLQVIGWNLDQFLLLFLP